MQKDFSLAVRSLLRTPALTIIIITILAVGIGASVAFFSIVNAALLRPLPYPDPARLVWMSEIHEDIPERQVSYPNFLDWQARAASFQSLAAVREQQVSLIDRGEAQPLDARMVTADYFQVLGVAPVAGRVFTAEEDRFGMPAVAVISYAFWQRHFGANRDVLGRVVNIDGRDVSIVGVMPKSFQHRESVALWRLTGQHAVPGGKWFERSNRMAGFVIGKLKPGVTLVQARTEMRSIQDQLTNEYPIHNQGNSIEVRTLQEAITGPANGLLWLCFGASGLLLLISCANTVNFLLVKAVTRRKEVTLRLALGGSALRIARESLTENLLLALTAGGAGLLIAKLGLDVLLPLVPQDAWRQIDIRVDWAAAAFALLVSVAIGLGFGLLPILQSRKRNLSAILSSVGRTTSDRRTVHIRKVFVAAQIACAAALLIGAALMVNSLLRMFNSSPGFDASNVITFNLLPRGGQRSMEGRDPSLSYLYIAQQLGALPGVDAVSLTNELPGWTPTWQTDINPRINGAFQKLRPGELINVDWSIVGADYFRAMRIPLKAGRDFTPSEIADGSPVMLVDEALANRFWPNEGAVGQYIKYDSATPIKIIGVAGNVRQYDNAAPGRIRIYTPYGRLPMRQVTLVLRSAGGDPKLLLKAVQREVQAVDPNALVYNAATLESLLAKYVAPKMFATLLLGIFAGISIILAMTGTYAVISAIVAERSGELGIRMVLGASGGNIIRLMLKDGLILAATGTVIGMALAYWQTHLLQNLLFGVSPTDPWIFSAVSLGLIMIAIGASLIPALRATRIAPFSVLKLN